MPIDRLRSHRRRAGLVGLVALAFATLSCGGTTSSARPTGPNADRAPDEAAMRACSAPSECMVVARTCCGTCGAATSEDSIAINARFVRENHGYPCDGNPSCPDCYQQTAPTLTATCHRDRCEVLDLASRDDAHCSSDDQCVLRSSVCCDCGAAPWIAIRSDRVAAVSERLCGAIATCPACAAPYPAHLRARCVEARCTAVESAEAP